MKQQTFELELLLSNKRVISLSFASETSKENFLLDLNNSHEMFIRVRPIMINKSHIIKIEEI